MDDQKSNKMHRSIGKTFRVGRRRGGGGKSPNSKEFGWATENPQPNWNTPTEQKCETNKISYRSVYRTKVLCSFVEMFQRVADDEWWKIPKSENVRVGDGKSQMKKTPTEQKYRTNKISDGSVYRTKNLCSFVETFRVGRRREWWKIPNWTATATRRRGVRR